MSPRVGAVSHLFALVVAAVAWPALMLQYWLSLWSAPWPEATLRFFSFFTILSNLLVALVATAWVTGGSWAPVRFWRGPRVRGLAALSISVTCLVYAAVLQSLWHPMGPELVADRALHYVVPFLFLVWWIALLPHGSLDWGDALRWLGFPVVFLAWTLARGAVVHEYPYPFMDVRHLGYAAVLLNSALVGALFLGLGMGLVAMDRALARGLRARP
ncbi:Pr6Pr family membrane protein [Luteibacter sp. 9135]|uniref:Pr6Pr family membrane protein n=1 Tax=Luteibacter sp. 9135 TaxID=1500893 RepID=UPI000569A1DE|nr:Pr6Pr family membrane protein [Luteibacter sp. 9135]